MASRLRGLTCLSSTVIPRVQKLLETDVLKVRPLWLDVVEAYPPLPPPVLPQLHRTGRAPVIKYLHDERKNVGSTAKVKIQMHALSLFESRSVKKVHRLQEDLQEAIEPVSLEEELPTSTDEHVKGEERASPSPANTELFDKQSKYKAEEHVSESPHFVGKLHDLQAILKQLEENN